MKKTRCPQCGLYKVREGENCFGNVSIVCQGELEFDGEVLKLPKCMFEIAEALILARGRALTYGYLADLLGRELYDNTIAVYIGRLRSYFRSIDPQFDQIESLKGFGAYRWLYQQPQASRRLSFKYERRPSPELSSLNSSW